MELKKDDIITAEITDMGSDGEGIGKIDGFPVFIKDAVKGDRVSAKITKAKKNMAYGRMIEILKPSEQQNTKMLVEVVLNNDPTASIGMISRYKLSMLESFHDV